MIYFKFKQYFKIFKIFKHLVFFITIFISFFMFFSAQWINKNYNEISLNDILFHMFQLTFVEKKLTHSFLTKTIFPTIFLSLIIFYINFIINNKIIKNKKLILPIKKFNIFNIISLFERQKDYILKLSIYNKIFILKIKRKIILILVTALNVVFILKCVFSATEILNVKNYEKETKIQSDFIETNYINPKNVELKFPKDKQNLIYIFVESLESTFFSKKLGGNEEENLLKPLTKLMETGINFSNTEKYGGAYSVFGTTFTTAGLVAQTLALPLKMNKKIVNNQHLKSSFLKKAYGLGNILEKEGYFQMFIMGSDKKFGNRDSLLKNHGKYEILDYYKAKEEKHIKNDYKKWWGFEDGKLFEIAKKKLLEIQNKTPFNLTILTSNTHFPGGYVEENYKRKFKDGYSDAIYCSSKQIKEFIKWIKTQKFYDKTTIIISGDHLSMDKDHFLNMNKNFTRTVFNLFINSKTQPIKTKSRVFTTFDMFPSTLSSLGVKINGNRLGLGTNLFSEEKTLAEKYGIDKLNKELKKKSLFYNNLIF